MRHPVTPDGRYFVVRGRLWRCRNPGLAADVAEGLVKRLMTARRALRGSGDDDTARALHAQVDTIKRALGERGEPWWTDGAPDFNRRMVRNSPYAAWFATAGAGESDVRAGHDVPASGPGSPDA